MPRRRAPTRISDPDARLVVGRMIYSAAAEALGGVYGTIAMERALAFSPRARAERKALQSHSGPPSVKRSLPTGACKKWLEGHVPFEQTLALISEPHPHVAERMQQVRESDVVKVLTVAKDNYQFVGDRIAALSPELFGEYLGAMALGHCNPDLSTQLAAGILKSSTAGRGPEVLAVVLGVDRQMPSIRAPAAARILDKAFEVTLRQSANAMPEIAFSSAAIGELWSHRKAERERIEDRQLASQKFVTEPSKLLKFVTKQR
jgi:hypothetical protein